MNFLAHIYLSNNNKSIQIGNFIADSVKGRKYENYPKNIKTGILLHRQIDWFTDNNDIVRGSKRRLDKKYGHYKGVIIDIFYDHFLAKNWNDYSDIPLKEYSSEFYDVLQSNYEVLPERIKVLTPYLIEGDWLTNYASLEGIKRVLIGMNKRTNEKSQMHLAIHDLELHYKEFEQDFTSFFKILRNFSALKLSELNKKFE
ncbi:MAG: acyl carrier protein phosphodiesterase [Flavobacteriaceae bacterium]|nr:acyl carrier protein phosphodiesterase [Flavobacteriaceae bacterium]